MDGENGIYLSVVSQCVNCAAASAKDTEKRKKIAGKNDFRDFPPPRFPHCRIFSRVSFQFLVCFAQHPFGAGGIIYGTTYCDKLCLRSISQKMRNPDLKKHRCCSNPTLFQSVYFKGSSNEWCMQMKSASKVRGSSFRFDPIKFSFLRLAPL